MNIVKNNTEVNESDWLNLYINKDNHYLTV